MIKLFRKLNGLRILALVLLAFIFITAVANGEILLDAYKTTAKKEGGFSEFIDTVETSYTSKIKNKTDYINLNGLFARYSGRKIYNGVATLNNGMLTNDSIPEVDVELAVKSIGRLGKWIEQTDREFLFVQEPFKMDKENELLPVGADLPSNEISDSIVGGLRKQGIDVLDLREQLAKTPQQIQKYFYKTDHHWNNLGAFTAYNLIADKIEELFPDEKINSDLGSEKNWKKTKYEEWFLGTHGKRVGVNYGGIDDYILYEPKFETEISTYISNHMAYYKGDFSKANIRKEYFDQPDYFNESPYCAYIGGDYPIVQHRNQNTGNNLKLLIIKDSFQLPVQSFLSTTFSQVEVLDPRYYNSSSIAEYIEVYDPDMVIFMVNPSVMYNEVYYKYGIEKAEKLRKAEKQIPIYENKALKIKPDKSQYNYISTAKGLSAGTKYTFSLKNFEMTGAKKDGITVALFHPKNKKIYASTVIDKASLKEEKGFEWSFVTPRIKGDMQLIIYSGTYKNSANTGVVIEGATLLSYA